MDQTIFRKRDLLKRPKGSAPLNPQAKINKRRSINTWVAVGLWALLWGGYNTSNAYVRSPGFPQNTTELIHGLRAFLPLVAGWIALLIVLARARSAVRWVMGPLGLILLYALIGMVSSLVLSIDPIDASYWGANYISLVLVLFAIASVEDSIPNISKVITFNWIVAAALTFVLLGLLPVLGGGMTEESDIYSASTVRRSYNGGGELLGMAGARNTGFGRYAAIAALAGLARMRVGTRRQRIIWGGVFVVATYALILSNGRTEVFAFIVSAFLVLYADKSKRVIYIMGGIGMGVLLGLRGFYQAFFEYFTRTGQVDFTMTGRTETWQLGLQLLNDSPWVGLGFQADRIYLPFQQHMHNAFLSALVQSGILGGAAMFLGLIVTAFLIIKYFFVHPLRNKEMIPAELPGIFTFVIVSSVAESTFAYFSAAWLLSAPIIIYVLTLHKQVQQSSAALAQGKERGIALFRSRRNKQLSPATEPVLSPAPAGSRHRR